MHFLVVPTFSRTYLCLDRKPNFLMSKIFAGQANTTAALVRGEIELEEGWFSPLNGYQYRATDSLAFGEPWIETRRICQSWGADLKVHGVRNVRIRKYGKSLQTKTRMFEIKSHSPRTLTSRLYNKPGFMTSLTLVHPASRVQVDASLDVEIFDNHLCMAGSLISSKFEKKIYQKLTISNFQRVQTADSSTERQAFFL